MLPSARPLAPFLIAAFISTGCNTDIAVSPQPNVGPTAAITAPTDGASDCPPA